LLVTDRFEQPFKPATTSFNFKSNLGLQIKLPFGVIAKAKRERKENNVPGPGAFLKIGLK
jgi:hypothetical protein